MKGRVFCWECRCRRKRLTGAASTQSASRISQLIPGRKKHFPAQLINEGLSIRIQVQRMNSELKALVVDDEAQVREFVSAVLRTEGWNVTQSASAEEAIEKLNQAPWSVVFCDVMLGGADGYSVLRRFEEELPDTKVVLMTGHGSAAGA